MDILAKHCRNVHTHSFEALTIKFNKKGWRTLALSGSDPEAVRVAAIERLAGDETENALDYIISADMVNSRMAGNFPVESSNRVKHRKKQL